MSRLATRPLTLVAALLAAAAGGCSWLLGVSEDPVVYELGIDGSGDAEPDRPDARDAAVPDPPDVEDASDLDARIE